MTSKVYENITGAQGEHFLQLAFANGMKATEQTGSFSDGKADGQLTGFGVIIDYHFATPNMTVEIVKKSGLAFFLKDEKIFSIMDSYVPATN